MSRCTYLNCRQEVHGSGVFCGRCGRRLESNREAASPEPDTPALAWIVPAAVIAVIVVGMVGFVATSRVLTVAAPASATAATFAPAAAARNASMPSAIRLGPEVARDWRIVDVTLDARSARVDPLSFDGDLVVHLQRLVGRGTWRAANRAELRVLRVTGEAADGATTPMLGRFADEGGSFDRALVRIHPERLLDLRQPTVIEYDDALRDGVDVAPDVRYLRR